jgi:aminoglycoside 6-adenylyltransferase
MQPDRDETIDQIIGWGAERQDVRALVLTSTRTAPGATVDCLSDYDVIVAVSDVPGIVPFFESRAWLEAFGRVLVLYRDPISPWFGPESAHIRHRGETGPAKAESFCDEKFAYITEYEQHGLKIDFTVMPASLLRHIARSPLGPDLDLGYRVLLDKDGLTDGMASPTHHAYIPSPPAQAEYLETVELFFHECTYLAKYLWRDDLVPAKTQLDSGMKAEHLRKMLEWKAEIDAGWTLRLKAHGRGLKKILPPNLWAELEATYVGASLEENWAAMWRTIDLFEKIAREVGAALGYAYPEEMHRRSAAYFRWVQNLPREEA